MKILYCASEVDPFIKTGGLGDVAGSLPPALERLGHDVRVAMPAYQSIKFADFSPQTALNRLPVFLNRRPYNGKVLLGKLPRSNVPVYFLHHHELFDRPGVYGGDDGDYPDNHLRFGFLGRGALELVEQLDWWPDVIICNDWQTALIPTYLKHLDAFRRHKFWKKVKTLFVIHNLAYQGLFDLSTVSEVGLPASLTAHSEMEFWGRVNWLKGAILYSDHVATVSRKYSKEIQTAEYGCGLDDILRARNRHLSGIMNGVDYSIWDPQNDTYIPATYSAKDLSGKKKCKEVLQQENHLPVDPDIPLIGMITRLVDQKGVDLIAYITSDLMKRNCQFVFLGLGDRKYEILFEQLAKKRPEQFATQLAFDNRLAHRINAGSDMFLMPSRFEPCGMAQLYSIRYGTIPIVRQTGGLADSIKNATPASIEKGKGIGFVFKEYTGKKLLNCIDRALRMYEKKPELWAKLIQNAMTQDFSWRHSAKEYEKLLKRLTRSSEHK